MCRFATQYSCTMKKTLLVLSALCLSTWGFSQTCTPDQNITQPGVYPMQLPTGNAGQYYEETVQFCIPSDTDVDFGGNPVNAVIDSIKMLSVNGLPAGLTHGCTPSNCVFPGGQTSCGIIYGTIDASAQGTYNFVIPVIYYARINSSIPYQQQDTIYSIFMDVNGTTGIRKVTGEVRAYPNPAGKVLTVALPFSAFSAEFQVFDSQGKSIQLSSNRDLNRLELNTETLSEGMYYGVVSNGHAVYHFHFIRH